jgi:hypothetical protein
MPDPVFNGQPIVLTDTKDLESDNTLPDGGALKLGSINTLGAFVAVDGRIAGAKGNDAKIIHGNLWEDIDGNEGMVVTGSETTHIMGAIARTFIDHNETINVLGNLTQTVVGSTTYVYINSQDITNVASVTNNYSSVHAAQQPTSWFQNYTWVGATYDMNLQFAVFNHQFAVLNTQMGVVNFQVFPQNYQFFLSNMAINIVNYQIDGFKIENTAFANKIEALGNKIHALATKVGGPRIFGIAAKLLGCVVLGPNQVL